MPAPAKGARLGGSPAHERHILANLATALFEHGRITTTHAKARRLRPVAERLITFAKRGDLHARRQVMSVVRDKGVVHELFTEIGPRFSQREGGYTRIIKRGPRKGDQAPMAIIELVESLTVAQEAVGEAEKARGTQFADKGAAKASTKKAAAAEADTKAAEAQDAPAASKSSAASKADEGAKAEPKAKAKATEAKAAGKAETTDKQAAGKSKTADAAADKAEAADTDASKSDKQEAKKDDSTLDELMGKDA